MIHILINLPEGKKWEGNQLPGTSLDKIFDAVWDQHPNWVSVEITIARDK